MNKRDRSDLSRRAALGMFGAMGAALVVGCGGGDTGSTGTGGGGGGGGTSTGTGTGGGGGSGSTSTGSTTGSTGTGSAECKTIPDETAGPYPDKTGMINDPQYFRKDVTEGKVGVPLVLTFNVVNVNSACAAVSGAVVEIWHCDAAGDYSEYTQPGYDGTGQTFLRGLQTADSGGQVEFTTIYPGWYSGRATHIHIDVYINGKVVKTTQMAFQEDITAKVYAVDPYASKGTNPMTNAADMVFSDGDTYQLSTLTGDTTKGFTAVMEIGIAI